MSKIEFFDLFCLLSYVPKCQMLTGNFAGNDGDGIIEANASYRRIRICMNNVDC